MNKSIVLTGGGTGGHAYPALSIADSLRTEYPDCEILYVGSRGGIEARLAGEERIPFVGLTSRKVRKVLSPDTIITVGYTAKGLVEALGVLKTFKPDVVIGTGGYVAASVVFAQVLRRGKTLILEPDVVPGRTNGLLSRYVSRICVAFEDTVRRFPSGRAVVTGMPVRAAIKDPPDKTSARTSLGLSPGLFTLVVAGGSQGARRLNEVVIESIPELRQFPVQLLHQVGARNFEEANGHAEKLAWPDYHVRPYLDDMISAYAAADLVMCRSGSSTVAEVTAMGIPSILVPYPYAHRDHQRFNAEVVARNSGGILVGDSELTADFLVKTVKRFIDSPDELCAMAKASRSIGRPYAASTIAKIAADL